MYYNSFISLAEGLVVNGFVDDGCTTTVARSIVNELIDLTFSGFDMAMVSRWKEVEYDLKNLQRSKAIDNLLRSIRRVYPSLLLSDFGLDVIQKLFETQTSGQSIQDVIGSVPDSLVRNPSGN